MATATPSRRLAAQFRRRARHLAAAIYPVHCLSCGQPTQAGDWLCPPCRASLPRGPTRCPRCAGPTDPSGSPCGLCRGPAPLISHTLAPLAYREPVSDWLRSYKYRGQPGMARPLSRLVAPAVGHWLRTLPWDQPWLVPVPLHRRRLAERGYNQAGLLARLWGQRLGLPVRHGVLRRVRATAAQAELAGHQRHRNMQGAFRAQGVAGRDIILVDDVVTSMATAEAATEALLAAEAASVSVLALARGGLDRSP